MAFVAGIDSSTQSCKVIIFDGHSGKPVRSGRAPHPQGSEIEPTYWWEALNTAIKRAGGLQDVAAVSIAGQQHGMVLLDDAGEVVRPALLWNDTRSGQAAADLTAEVGADMYSERTGLVPVASFTATKLRWVATHEPELAKRIRAIALPHDWLTWRLRGYGPANSSEHGPDLTQLVTDRSDASGTAYFNPTTNEYDLDLLARALEFDSVDQLILPRVLDPGEAIAGSEIVFGPGAGDNAAAALGLGLSHGDVAISIGTSGTVFASSPQPVQDSSGVVAGFADALGGFLPIVTTMNAARVIDTFSDLLQVSHAQLGELALQAEPGAAGLVLQPWFEGERTPNLPDATATLFNMTLEVTTRKNVARAAFEGILCSLAFGIDALGNHGASAKRLFLIGGASQNPAFQRIAAQVFGAHIVVPEPGEYVARGAALQAAWALTGKRPDWSLEIHSRISPAHEPQIREGYNAVLPDSIRSTF